MNTPIKIIHFKYSGYSAVKYLRAIIHFDHRSRQWNKNLALGTKMQEYAHRNTNKHAIAHTLEYMLNEICEIMPINNNTFDSPLYELPYQHINDEYYTMPVLEKHQVLAFRLYMQVNFVNVYNPIWFCPKSDRFKWDIKYYPLAYDVATLI